MYCQWRYLSSWALVLLIFSVAHTSARGNGPADTKLIMSRARAALGDEAKLQGVTSFSATWKYRRQIGESLQYTGEIKEYIALPDKYVKDETMSLPMGQILLHDLLNGDHVESERRSTSTDIIVENRKNIKPEELVAMRKRLRRSFVMQVLPMLLIGSSAFPIEFTYLGEAEAGDGQAYVIAAQGPDDFKARLFFDRRTFRLLLLSYNEPNYTFQLSEPADRAKTRVDQATPTLTSSPSDVEVNVRFADYRIVDGISIPHLITYEKNGVIFIERELKSFKLNPTFKTGTFEVKKSR